MRDTVDNTSTLTEQQAKVLDYINEYRREFQCAPTQIEIARHFGWSSQNSAECHLQAMERKGVIVRRRGVARGILVVENHGR